MQKVRITTELKVWHILGCSFGNKVRNKRPSGETTSTYATVRHVGHNSIHPSSLDAVRARGGIAARPRQ